MRKTNYGYRNYANSSSTHRSRLIKTPIDGIFLLMAELIDLLREDATGTYNAICNDDYPLHTAKECAIVIYNKYLSFLQENPEADHIEVALEVIKLHGYS